MTINDLLLRHTDLSVVYEADFSREFDKVYCCDLLSYVMGRAPVDCVWVTVMGNINSIAVAVLADMACIVLAEGAQLDGPARIKAESEGVNVLKINAPVFDVALKIYEIKQNG